jgi:hypothetical protein
MSIHVACLWMCVLFYFSIVCLHVCAYASKFEVHCGSTFEPGASRLSYYCTPPVCIPDVLGALAVWRHTKKKKVTFNKASVSLAGSCSETGVSALETQVGSHSRLFKLLWPDKSERKKDALWTGVETPWKEHSRERFRGSTERCLTQPPAHRPVWARSNG